VQLTYYSIHGNGLDNLIHVAGVAEQIFQNFAYGGAGNDLLSAEFAAVSVNGEEGDDMLRLRLHMGPGHEIQAEVHGGTGRDMLIIAATSPNAGITFSLALQGTEQALVASTGNSVLATGIEDLWVSDQGYDTQIGGHHDTLHGNAGDNMIIASAGSDWVDGGGENDLLFGDTPTDIGLSANPELEAWLWGNTYAWANPPGADTLMGGAGNDTLVGGGGADLPLGGDGNDVIHGWHLPLGPDAPGRHVSTEFIASYRTLSQPDGADTLDGGRGADTMLGGAGDDLYKVDHAGDVVTELAGEGHDLVQSRVSYTLPNHVEDLTLQGLAVFGVGNALANQIIGNALDNVLWGNGGADTLTGLDGDDHLDGGTGPDRMVGGRGNDYFQVDDALDVVVERAGEGRDGVISHLPSYRLRAHVEDLYLAPGALDGFGNADDNLLQGNDAANRLDDGDGADTLVGGLGNDRLTGGLGADVLRFLDPGEGTDRIIGFASGEDRIEISAAGFGGGLLPGMSLAGRFFGATLPAGTTQGAFAYDQAAGRLVWDANGSAAGGRSVIALLDPGTALAATDFIVIG
jgi:Ca2+-binding RTX toxin-like protein